MQIFHWVTVWSFSTNTSINASEAAKRSNNVIIMGAGFSGICLAVLLKWTGKHETCSFEKFWSIFVLHHYHI